MAAVEGVSKEAHSVAEREARGWKEERADAARGEDREVARQEALARVVKGARVV